MNDVKVPGSGGFRPGPSSIKQATATVLLSVAFTSIGLACGWFASQQTKSSGGHSEEGGDSEHGEGHSVAKPTLSPQALQNLGIEFKEVEPTSFWMFKAVPAEVTESPLSIQPIYAPIGGRVVEICALPGSVVSAGGLVVKLVRDALPRPALTLTDQILKPANEDFHKAVGELRRAHRGLDLLRTEVERVQRFVETGTQDGLPILPRKNLIDLRYEVARSEMEVQNAEQELRRHGCSDAQVDEMAKGLSAPILGQQVWRQALQQNGLWTQQAEALHSSLPEKLKALPWSIAAVGELAAAGIPLDELTSWLKAEPEAADHFLELAGLLQQGHALAALKAMHLTGGLEQTVMLKAPATAPDWDLLSVDVKPGQKVEAGQVIAMLSNPRQLQLQAEPVGGEVAAVLSSIGENAAIDASPLVAGTGPELKGLKLAYVTSAPDGHGTLAVLRVQNAPNAARNGESKPHGRTWKLRTGLRYTLRVPMERLDDVFVLPTGAVTDDGPDKVVFIQDGDSFRAAKVVVRYQDHQFAVLDAKHSEVFPGDTVATCGAFGLGLALKAGSGAADPHAGHQH